MNRPRPRLRRRWALLPAVLALAAGSSASHLAWASATTFGPHDIQTLFYIAKSNGPDRVDYGMRLDENCGPAKRDAVFPYWREFDHGQSARVHSLGFMASMAYGVSEQQMVHRRPDGSDYQIRLKQVDRPIWVTTWKNSDGSCTALARSPISGVRYAELLSIYVQLSGPISVSYVDVKGKNLDTGKALVERIQH